VILRYDVEEEEDMRGEKTIKAALDQTKHIPPDPP
jgi:hypothetical protein